MSDVLNNVINLYKRYGDKIKSERHLILIYWKDVDGIDITKDTIPTQSFINNSTNASKILQAFNAYQILNEEEKI